MIRILSIMVVAISFCLTPAFAQDGRPEFNIAATKTCFENTSATDRRVCVGLSANICMESEFGGSTVGMGACIDSELQWWDAKLNSTYASYLKLEKKSDEEAKRDGFSAPNKAAALKEMQRSWILYRDATCKHEAAQWNGGTGAGPAYLGCLLDETARQAMVLINRMESYDQ